MRIRIGLILLASAWTGAAAQTQAPLIVAPAAETAVLPRNTPVVLRLEEGLSTKSHRQKKGDPFALSVARNVVFRGHIVIPRGARALGRIAWQTRKGAFGKSGKMELAFEYIEVGETRIPITGKFREEGEGNSDATVSTALFLSVLGSGFITGHSAEIPAGQEFTAWTNEDIPIAFPDGTPGDAPQAPAGVLAAVPLKKPAPVRAPSPKPQLQTGGVWCVTCQQ